MEERTRNRLSQVSTATLTTQLFKRGLRNVFVQSVGPLDAEGGALVGPAFTLRYIPAREDLDRLEVFDDPEHPQRKAIEAAPPGSVLVMDCREDARAASAGGILAARLKMRGVAGLVTDGGLRDSAAIRALDFPAYCARPSAPTNLTLHHAVDIGVPIGCGGVPVYPGDIVVGDADGVVIIPSHLAEEVAEDAVEQERFEAFVSEEIAAGKSIVGLYPPDAGARQRYETWSQARGFRNGDADMPERR